MGLAVEARGSRPPFARLLREWRSLRRMSQMELALQCEVSARHLGFLETGKAKPSRDMVARVANTLAVPPRERNLMFVAAGFAPPFSEYPLETPGLDRMREAITLILEHQEPYPAFVLNRHFDLLMANQAAARINAFLMEGRASLHSNLLHQIFDPADFRQVIDNWPEVAARFLRQLQDELAAAPTDRRSAELLEEVLRYPEVPEAWRLRDPEAEPSPIVTLNFRSPAGPLRFFETITTFAAPFDITLGELRIDCAFPADEATGQLCRKLAAEA